MNNNEQRSAVNVLELSCIDMSALKSLRELMEDKFVELINLFLENVPRQLTSLKDSSEKEDAVAIFRAAHSLKSSSGNIGANRLSAHCKALEAIGRTGKTTGSREMIKKIETEFVHVKRILKVETEKIF